MYDARSNSFLHIRISDLTYHLTQVNAHDFVLLHYPSRLLDFISETLMFGVMWVFVATFGNTMLEITERGLLTLPVGSYNLFSCPFPLDTWNYERLASVDDWTTDLRLVLNAQRSR